MIVTCVGAAVVVALVLIGTVVRSPLRPPKKKNENAKCNPVGKQCAVPNAENGKVRRHEEGQ